MLGSQFHVVLPLCPWADEFQTKWEQKTMIILSCGAYVTMYDVLDNKFTSWKIYGCFTPPFFAKTTQAKTQTGCKHLNFSFRVKGHCTCTNSSVCLFLYVFTALIISTYLKCTNQFFGWISQASIARYSGWQIAFTLWGKPFVI